MGFKNIELMKKNLIDHSNIFLGEEISYSDSSSKYGYGEYNGLIINCINDVASDGPFSLICDNVIKFIDYRPSSNETDDYKAITQDEINLNLSFSYNIIKRAYDNRDIELLNFEWNRIDKELENFIANPYQYFNEEYKGIALALFIYFNESISLYNNIYDEDKVNKLRAKLLKLKAIYVII